MIYNSKFGGLIPRIHARILPNGSAEVAVDVNLEHGSIKPWPKPTLKCDGETDIVTVHFDKNCACVTWPIPVDVVDYIAGGCEFKIWNERDRLRIESPPNFCNGDECFLGVPCPTEPLLIDDDGIYVYTWINKFGQEGPPSAFGQEVPPPMYMLFGGSNLTDIAIQYMSFDGTTVTDLNPGAFVTRTVNYGGGLQVRVTPTGTILLMSGNAEMRNLFYIQGSSQPYFTVCYERFLDADDLTISEILFTTDGEKAFLPATNSGVAVLSTSKVATNIDYYRGSNFPLGSGGDGVEASQGFAWHNGYLIGLNDDFGRIEAWSWDGTNLTPIANITLPMATESPWIYYSETGRMQSDGNYIYISFLADWHHVIQAPWFSPRGFHAGIQILTFDGVAFTWANEDVDEENQTPDHLPDPPNAGSDRSNAGSEDTAIGGGYLFILDVTDTETTPRDKRLLSYTYREGNWTLVDTYQLDDLVDEPVRVSDASSETLLLHEGNMWLAVQRHGIWSVENGIFTQLYDGDLTPDLDYSPHQAQLLAAPLVAREIADLHSTMLMNTANSDFNTTAVFPKYWFDFQDQDYTTARSNEGTSLTTQRMTSVNTNIKGPPLRAEMFQSIETDTSYMIEDGSSNFGSWINSATAFQFIFTVGTSDSTATQMAAFACRDGSNQLFSTYFVGNDYKVEVKNSDGEVLTFTKAGMADGELHVVAITLNSGDVEVNFDDDSLVTQSFAGSGGMGGFSKDLGFGEVSGWATDDSDGVFTDMFVYYRQSKTLSRTDLDIVIQAVYSEIGRPNESEV